MTTPIIPVKECSLGPLRSQAAQGFGVILIDSQGGAFSAGDNCYGQLGRSGDTVTFQRVSNIPPMLVSSCGYWHTLSLDENGQVWSWDTVDGQLGTGVLSNRLQPAPIPSLEGTSALVAGRFHSMAHTQRPSSMGEEEVHLP